MVIKAVGIETTLILLNLSNNALHFLSSHLNLTAYLFYQNRVVTGIIRGWPPTMKGRALIESFFQNLQTRSVQVPFLTHISWSLMVSKYHLRPWALIAAFFLFLGSLARLNSILVPVDKAIVFVFS